MALLLRLVLLTHSMTALRTLRLLAYAIAVVPVSLPSNLGSHVDVLNLSCRAGLLSEGIVPHLLLYPGNGHFKDAMRMWITEVAHFMLN